MFEDIDVVGWFEGLETWEVAVVAVVSALVVLGVYKVLTRKKKGRKKGGR